MKKIVLFCFLSSLFPLGELLQYLVVGPSWIRWYLSDFGLSASIASIFFTIKGYKFIKKGLFCGFLYGIIAELLQFLCGHGDPIDVGVITVGFFVGLLVTNDVEFLFEKSPSLKSVF
ncbi:MAG: hypothetical protein AB1333_03190 [Patescibacteria group bacterium]